MRNILVVCHGNINRSALCEAVLKEKLPSEFEVVSCGFVNPGRRAAKKTRDLALWYNYNLMEHRSVVIDWYILRWADLVIYMDGGNLKRLNKFVGGNSFHKFNFRCLGEWATPPVSKIKDPAFMAKDSAEFKSTIYQIIYTSKNLANYLIAEHGTKGKN